MPAPVAPVAAAKAEATRCRWRQLPALTLGGRRGGGRRKLPKLLRLGQRPGAGGGLRTGGGARSMGGLLSQRWWPNLGQARAHNAGTHQTLRPRAPDVSQQRHFLL
jgi:hypothetical protein